MHRITMNPELKQRKKRSKSFHNDIMQIQSDGKPYSFVDNRRPSMWDQWAGAAAALQKSLRIDEMESDTSVCNDVFSKRKTSKSVSNSDLLSSKWEILVLKAFSRDEQSSYIRRNSIFCVTQNTFGVKMDPKTKWRYFEEFSKVGLESGSVHCSEVQFLLERLGVELDPNELQRIVRDQSSINVGQNVEVSAENDLFTFEMFMAVAYQALSRKASTVGDNSESAASKMRRVLPLNPDSQFKQMWDLLCLVLLVYCSFYVPFNLAFDTAPPAGTYRIADILDIVINAIFMIDIALTFLTAYYDTQGFLVKDLRIIAEAYCRGWLLPDIAGSFPFDTVITAAVRAHSSGQSVDLSAMKAIRLLKLTRAARFVSKLNKLKERADLSMLGPAISLVSSLFLLVFVAHLLGCFFFMFVGLDPAINWMVKYSPSLLEGPVEDRYGGPPSSARAPPRPFHPPSPPRRARPAPPRTAPHRRPRSSPAPSAPPLARPCPLS
jgi:hypothetical protein